jgi:hypothetical protein
VRREVFGSELSKKNFALGEFDKIITRNSI